MLTKSFAVLRLAAALALLSPTASNSEELKAYAAKSVTLDALSGTLYFTPRNGEYALVATFDSDTRPFRVVATLQPGQRIELSAPHEIGEPASIVEIRREGDRVVYENRPRSADPVPSPGEPDLLSGP